MDVAIDSGKLDLLILMRLSNPPKKAGPSALRKPLEKYLEAAVPRSQVATLFNERVAALREKGWVAADGFALTGAGRQILAKNIGTDRVVWRSASTYVAALSLGLDPADAKVRKRLRSAEGVAAAVLSRNHELGAAAPTLNEAVDRLGWKLLTGEAGKLTLNGARLHLLSDELGAPARGDVARTARRLAAKELGATGTEAAQLGDSLGRRWLAAAPTPPIAPPAAEPAPVQPSDGNGSLEGFADRVQEVARGVDAGRFGSRKVFISAVWRAMDGDPVVAAIDLPAFKQRLCEANRAGLLILHRADLVGAMDPGELAESEARYMNATFHFIEAPRA